MSAIRVVNTVYRFWVTATVASVCLAGPVEQTLAEAARGETVPQFTEQLSITGEQANAFLTAVTELRSNQIHDLAQYEIDISQSSAAILVLFRQPGRQPYQVASKDGPSEFEVLVSRPSGNVLKAHFER